MKEEKHYFTPIKDFETGERVDNERFCGRCGKYLTDEIHLRSGLANKIN